ncbi:MAG: PQQ-binding-like beta-propeller repeat protein [Deltaproteobacteria bacterium]|nr:PQQ-binding-like beta-propeller repeat protein [Deltaproteobacteria bacterium]
MSANRNVDAVVGLLCITIALAAEASAGEPVELFPGDLLVTNSLPDILIRVDPDDGQQTLVPSGLLISDPKAVACTRSVTDGNCERLLVVNGGGHLGLSILVSIDPLTGDQAPVTEVGALSFATGIAVSPEGLVFVSQVGEVVEVDLETGDVTPISSFENLLEPEDLIVDSDGDLLVVDASSSASLIAIDPDTGIQTVELMDDGTGQCSDGILFPRDLVEEESGTIAVAQGGCVWRYDPDDGAETPIGEGSNLGTLQGIDIEEDESLVVANLSARAVLRVDPTSGDTTTVSAGRTITFPTDVFVVRSPLFVPEPSASALGAAAVLCLGALRALRKSAHG